MLPQRYSRGDNRSTYRQVEFGPSSSGDRGHRRPARSLLETRYLGRRRTVGSTTVYDDVNPSFWPNIESQEPDHIYLTPRKLPKLSQWISETIYEQF